MSRRRPQNVRKILNPHKLPPVGYKWFHDKSGDLALVSNNEQFRNDFRSRLFEGHKSKGHINLDRADARCWQAKISIAAKDFPRAWEMLEVMLGSQNLDLVRVKNDPYSEHQTITLYQTRGQDFGPLLESIEKTFRKVGVEPAPKPDNCKAIQDSRYISYRYGKGSKFENISVQDLQDPQENVHNPKHHPKYGQGVVDPFAHISVPPYEPLEAARIPETYQDIMGVFWEKSASDEMFVDTTHMSVAEIRRLKNILGLEGIDSEEVSIAQYDSPAVVLVTEDGQRKELSAAGTKSTRAWTSLVISGRKNVDRLESIAQHIVASAGNWVQEKASWEVRLGIQGYSDKAVDAIANAMETLGSETVVKKSVKGLGRALCALGMNSMAAIKGAQLFASSTVGQAMIAESRGEGAKPTVPQPERIIVIDPSKVKVVVEPALVEERPKVAAVSPLQEKRSAPPEVVPAEPVPFASIAEDRQWAHAAKKIWETVSSYASVLGGGVIKLKAGAKALMLEALEFSRSDAPIQKETSLHLVMPTETALNATSPAALEEGHKAARLRSEANEPAKSNMQKARRRDEDNSGPGYDLFRAYRPHHQNGGRGIAPFKTPRCG